MSKPGLRTYRGANDLPRILERIGHLHPQHIQGVMTDKEAKHMNVGGEVLCYVY